MRCLLPSPLALLTSRKVEAVLTHFLVSQFRSNLHPHFYRYEYPLEGAIASGVRRSDFAFFDRDGKPLVWEHLGMLDDAQYRAKWQKKQA